MGSRASERREPGQGASLQNASVDGAEPAERGPRVTYLLVFCMVLAALVALSAVHLFPYVTRNYPYPTGWDAPTAVYRARLVAGTGIEQFGAIRAGAPLLLAVLMGTTGENAYTLVGLVPALLLWIAGLGAVGLVRGTYDIRPLWIPVIAFLTWTAFGENGMINLHLDNLLNASLTLPAFAAALAFIRWRRGAVAAGLLLAAAGVAHWPFYAFAAGILLVALLFFVAASYREEPGSLGTSLRSIAPLAGAVVGSAAVTGATFLARSSSGWIGARLLELRGQLRTRFLKNLHQVSTYYALPTAALGAALVLPRARAQKRPRRFFLALMASWIALTVLGGLAQLARLPTAGARELHYLFPASILTGLLVWWLARRLAGSQHRLRWVAAGLVVTVAVVGFAALAVGMRSNDRPWFDRDAVKELAEASAYVARVGGREPIVLILEPKASGARPTQLVVRSTLPLDQLGRTYMYFGSIQDYLTRAPLRRNGRVQAIPPRVLGEDGANPTVLVVQRFAPVGYREIKTGDPERVVAFGLAVLAGPVLDQALPAIDAPTGDMRGSHLAVAGLAIAALLILAGWGWSVGLLPADPMIRICLAPAFATGATTLVALGWAWAGLPLKNAWGAAPLVIGAAAGWLVALWSGRRATLVLPAASSID